MIKLLRIAVQEYKRNVFKRSFILALLSMPLLIGFGVGLGVVIINLGTNDLPVGYVDHAMLLADPIPALERNQPVEFLAYTTEESALEALEIGDLQAYYVISPDYFNSNEMELFYIEEPGQNATRQFYDFIQINLVAKDYPALVERVSDGNNVILRTLDGKRELPDAGPPLSIILPLFISFGFGILLLMSSGYMMHAVIEEKESSTMEVLITSVSPTQLMGGKVLGIMGISFTQLLVWTLFGIFGIILAGQGFGIEWFQNSQIEWVSILLIILLAIPIFITASALMVAIGSTVAEAQEAQGVVSIFMMLIWVPLWLIGVIGNTPNAPLPIALSLFPFTSLLTTSIRNIFVVVPTWQIGLSILIQVLFALGAIWFAGRAFRLGMLRYGQKIRLKELVGGGAASG